MTTYVALLRGVNVGGRNKVPMARLREALLDAGMSGARTYIQSGNIVVDARGSAATVAQQVHDVIEHAFGLTVAVVVVTADELDAIVSANPYADEPDHRRVHAIVMPTEPDDAGLAALAERVAAAETKAGTHTGDSVTVIGRVAYLHTPGGFGTSELAKAVGTGARNPVAQGTARNWATVTTLLEMATTA
ncbi:MAG: DUF1697 domain-containing protein [Candidatus Nanopelagicales bacterium]